MGILRATRTGWRSELYWFLVVVCCLIIICVLTTDKSLQNAQLHNEAGLKEVQSTMITELTAVLIWCLAGISYDGCDAAKILFSAAIDTGTHVGSMVPLINRLAEDGHHVTVFETASLKKPRKFANPNVKVIFIQVPQDKKASGSIANLIFRREIRADTLPMPYAVDDAKTLEFLRDAANVTTIRSIINTKWDLLIIDELFGVHSYAIAMNLKKFRHTPYIIYATTQMIHTTTISGRSYVSEPYLLTALPHDDSDVYSATLLSNRLDNIYNILLDLYVVDHYVPLCCMRSMAALDVDGFSFHKLLAGSSWIFADYVTRLKYALTESTDIRQIGASCRESSALTGDVARFVEDPASRGTIYVAFGSYINWAHAPQRLIDAYFEALAEFADYRVVFTYNGPAPRRPPGAHILLTKWAPQLEILAHPRTRVFVSHGGLKSWKETLCNAVPVVYMPVFAEQSYNAKLALRMGYARVLNKFSVDAPQIVGALREVLDNYAYFKERAVRTRALHLDRPVSALDEASYAVRRALRVAPTARRPYFSRRGADQSTADALYAASAALFALLIFALC